MHKNFTYVNGFLDSSNSFFSNVGGKIIQVEAANRQNIEIIDANENRDIEVCSIRVEFNNSKIFGTGDYLSAYKKYRQMRHDWWNKLASDGYQQWGRETKIIGNFFPVLSKNSFPGTEYPSEIATSFGQRLTKIDPTGLSHNYYDGVAKVFDINWLLEDGNGIAIGPDVGLLFAIAAATELNNNIGTFLDIGAGTGELSAYVIKKARPDKVILNEVSPALFEHLKNYIEPLANQTSTDVDFVFGDACSIEIPESIGFLSLGIYYGSQPGFIEKYGQRISRAMGERGILAVQSGMLEGHFNVSSITGDDSRLNEWEWFTKQNTLSAHFAHVESIFVADEVITLASNSKEAIRPIVERLISNYQATQIPQMVVFSS